MSWAQKAPLPETPIWHLFCSSATRAETLMQVRKWQDISPSLGQTPRAGELEKSLSAPISCAWIVLQGRQDLSAPAWSAWKREVEEISPWHSPSTTAVHSGEQTIWGALPSPNNQPGFQKPKIVSRNAISVKQEYCRAHAHMRHWVVYFK